MTNDFKVLYFEHKEYINELILNECLKRYPIGCTINRYGVDFKIDLLKIRYGCYFHISFYEFEVVNQQGLSVWSAKKGFFVSVVSDCL